MNERPGRLGEGSLDDLWEAVEAVAAADRVAHPGDPPARQPVHVVYVPADRLDAGTVAAFGTEALRLLDAHAPDGAALATATGLEALDLSVQPTLADRTRARVAAKLAVEPVEDLRIDFEDGYGTRGDAEEDAHAESAGRHLAGLATEAGGSDADSETAGLSVPFCGLRVKSFAEGAHRRSARTLDRFLGALLDARGGLPGGFVVTFPKVVAAAHVAAFAELLARLERAHGLAAGSLRFEVQLETPQAVYDPDGRVALPGIIAAAGGRLSAVHFGVYDYTAAVGLPPSEQRIDAAACDHARHVMQAALAGTGVRVSDGSTAVVPPDDTSASVHALWRLHAANVTRSLRHGFWQGWDLHPAHLPSRFAAVYAFLLADLDDARGRLRAWAAGSHRAGGRLDEPATITALQALVDRAVACGAAERER